MQGVPSMWFSCKQGERVPPPPGNLGITEAQHLDSKMEVVAGWFFLYLFHDVFTWSTALSDGTKGETVCKNQFEISEAKTRSHELEKEMHRNSSANKTVSLLLALTGNPRWQCSCPWSS